MKAFVLGAYGKIGLAAVKLLAQSDLVTEIAVAGRSLPRAEKVATEIGQKGIAIEADGTDEQKMIALTSGYDIIINASDNKAVVPSIRAAIHNSAHYCDVSWGQILEDAIRLDPVASAAGITAIVATGISPCITNLMGVHTARQLDHVVQILVGRTEIIDFTTGCELSPKQWLEQPQESLAVLAKYKPFLAWTLKMLQENGSTNMQAYCDGHWGEINPIKNGVVAPLAQGEQTTAYPYFSGKDFWGSLPRDLAQEPPMDMWFNPLPPQLDRLLREKSVHILDGNIDSEIAVNSFYETVESDPHYWLTTSEDFVPLAKIWVRAVGQKENRAAQHTCRFTAPMWDVNGYYLTSVALVAAVLKILRGEIKAQGVLHSEKAFDPGSFFDEVVALLPDSLPQGKLIDESFEWLE